MSHEEQIKGVTGLLAIWASWFIGHLSMIKEGVSIIASIAAFIASIIYARYWWLKTKKEKSNKWKQNGRYDN